ncbi:MAG: RNA methyltransferase [Bacteroidetes bacterium HGW-Bacteroidetes-6]|jgi:tRNA G18 (ribose-2'-O)-methylase SpoU|nr:MAG: RNA methyltransferase [Bacteroidetes bacterium HGW-Bacteroidetes-6]
MKKSMEELNRLTPEQFAGVSKLPLVVVLDNIRSQHNVGSVFRTSDAFRVGEILLCGITATPPNKEIQKTALGATETVKWAYYENTVDAVQELKARGYFIIGIEQTHDSIDISDEKIFFGHEKTALVFGNEVFGIEDPVLEYCNIKVEIPQYGTKHSINVSVCAGIVIWEFCRRHGNDNPLIFSASAGNGK